MNLQTNQPLFKHFRDIPLGEKAPAIILVGVCHALEGILEHIENGRRSEAKEAVNDLMMKNFTALRLYAQQHGIVESEIMTQVQEFMQTTVEESGRN